MFELTIPVKTHKGYLISTFQAGAMKFPESMAVGMPIWEPVDYLSFCIFEIKSLLSSNRDRSCIPVSVRPVGSGFVADCYWALTDLHSGHIGINQCYRFKKEHFNGVHGNPAEWWKDVDVLQPWMTVDRKAVSEWVKFVYDMVKTNNGDNCKLEVASPFNRMVLTPFLKVGVEFVCGLRLPSMAHLAIFHSNLNGVRPEDYLWHWYKALSRTLNVPGSPSILVFDADSDGMPTKWLVAENRCRGKICFSVPQEKKIFMGGCFVKTGKSCFAFKESELPEKLKSLPILSVVDVKEVEQWVYSTGTLLQRIKGIEEDPDILPLNEALRTPFELRLSAFMDITS